jgi:ubiquinone/menaquinone biosynthesis C-methylase UbiE
VSTVRAVADYWAKRAKAVRDCESIGVSETLPAFDATIPGFETDSGIVIVDCGCGYGRRAIPLGLKVQFVIAVDSSPTFLQRLKKKRGESRVELICASITAIPLRNNVADLALCSATLYYLPRNQWNEIRDEFSRVAKHSLIQYRNAMNWHNLRSILLRVWPVEHISLPKHLTLRPLYWEWN